MEGGIGREQGSDISFVAVSLLRGMVGRVGPALSPLARRVIPETFTHAINFGRGSRGSVRWTLGVYVATARLVSVL